MQQNTYTFTLSAEQQGTLLAQLQSGNYKAISVPYTQIAAETPDCKIALYQSGKCVVQGKGAKDWVTFTLEPLVLQQAKLGYENLWNPEFGQPHMGIDESGKGDFFGPLVIAAAYVDETILPAFRDLNVRDSKTITSDRKAEDMAKAITKILGNRFAVVTIGPQAYNRLYASIKNVNKLLAWGHARAIENLLEKVPDCPRAVADQFGPEREIKRALLAKGKNIQLVQRHKAESDPAVAAASVLARAGFLHALKKLTEKYGIPFYKGASEQVKQSAHQLVEKNGPQILLQTAKCHFKTTDQVLEKSQLTRAALGPDGAITSRAHAAETKS